MTIHRHDDEVTQLADQLDRRATGPRSRESRTR